MAGRSKFDAAGPRILENLRACIPRDVAAQRAGVARSTFYDWLNRGRTSQSGKYHRFAIDVDEAEAAAEAGLVLAIVKAATQQQDVKAAMWLLERSRPERWARPGVAARPVAPKTIEPSDEPPPDDGDWDLGNVTPLHGTR